MVRGWPASVLVVVLVAGCAGSSGGGPFDLTESELAAVEDHFAPIEAEEDAFDRLQASGDTSPEAISGFVEAVYSPDIVFLDTTFGDYREGHDAVVSMYQVFLSYFEDAVVEDEPTLVGDPTALQVIPFWGVNLGGHEFTEDQPLIEVDLVQISGDRVGSLELFYDVESIRRIYGDVIDASLVEGYADAWSSGSAAEVAALYAEEAVRQDGLAGVEAVGGEAVVAEAERWFEALPEASWTVRLAFGDRQGQRSGAIFEVEQEGCVVSIGILLDLDESGLITHERLHYEPQTLRTCGWVD